MGAGFTRIQQVVDEYFQSWQCSHDLRTMFVLIPISGEGAYKMNVDFELVGKTITGVVATPGKADSPHRIWMLQFSDGSHVEFVSPTARRRLIRATGGHKWLTYSHPEQPGRSLNTA